MLIVMMFILIVSGQVVSIYIKKINIKKTLEYCKFILMAFGWNLQFFCNCCNP